MWERSEKEHAYPKKDDLKNGIPLESAVAKKEKYYHREPRGKKTTG